MSYCLMAALIPTDSQALHTAIDEATPQQFATLLHNADDCSEALLDAIDADNGIDAGPDDETWLTTLTRSDGLTSFIRDYLHSAVDTAEPIGSPFTIAGVDFTVVGGTTYEGDAPYEEFPAHLVLAAFAATTSLALPVGENQQ